MDLCILIDEPELHLHPALQIALISYLREQASGNGLQFIIAAQSPAITDATEEGELYFLGEPNVAGTPENQLVKISKGADNIALIRTLTGDVAIVTSGRTLICVEGEPSSPGTNRLTDQRVLEILCPELNNIAVLPMGGRSQVLANASRLREALPATLAARICAIVDPDQTPPETHNLPSWAAALPVSMLENLLLEPEVVHEVLLYFKAIDTSTTVEDVRSIMASITEGLYEYEIELRVGNRLRRPRVRLKGTSVASLKESAKEAHASIDAVLGNDSRLSEIVDDATKAVDEIVASGCQLKRFHGKRILRALYRDHGPRPIVSYHDFVVQLARTASLRPLDVVAELRHTLVTLIST